MAGAGGIIQGVRGAEMAQPQGKSVTWVLIDQRMRSSRFYPRTIKVFGSWKGKGNGTQIGAEKAGFTQITPKARFGFA
jgi:hypothetical protein